MKLLLSTTFSLCALAATLTAAGLPDDLKTGGFAIGCQAWTFNHFSVTEAIDKTAATGAKVIEFFPGQKLSPEQPGVAFSHDAPKEVWEVVKKKLAEKKITAIAYGVVGLSKDEAPRAFGYSRATGRS